MNLEHGGLNIWKFLVYDAVNFQEEVQSFTNKDEDLDTILSSMSNIDWEFINGDNDIEIENFISNFSHFLIMISENVRWIPRLCEALMKYLLVIPKANVVRNYEPFIFLIWNVYFLKPSLKNDLLFVISKVFPHFLGASLECITGYVENLLSLISTCYLEKKSLYYKYTEYNTLFIKDLQQFILEIIINYITDADASLVLKYFQIPKSQMPHDLQGQVTKLDKIMCSLFSFIDKNCCDDINQFNWSYTEELFKKMKRIYKNKVLYLNMPNSLFHVHYFLAYMTSVHTSLSKHTCEYLWTLATDDDQPIALRCSAVRNITGYVAKFNFVKIGLTLEIISEMFAWCNAYLDKMVNVEEHNEMDNVFYCIANGALFILLHRHKEIIEYFESIKHFSAFAEVWQLSYLTMHKSNVLKEYPYRDQLPKLCKLFRNCFLGFIDTIVEEQVLRKEKPTLLIAMPFRYYFLEDSLQLLVKHRVSTENHYCVD